MKNKSATCPFCKSTYTKYLKQKDRYWCFDCNKYFSEDLVLGILTPKILSPDDIRKLEDTNAWQTIAKYNLSAITNKESKEPTCCPNCKSTHVRFSTRSMKHWCYECNMYF